MPVKNVLFVTKNYSKLKCMFVTKIEIIISFGTVYAVKIIF